MIRIELQQKELFDAIRDWISLNLDIHLDANKFKLEKEIDFPITVASPEKTSKFRERKPVTVEQKVNIVKQIQAMSNEEREQAFIIAQFTFKSLEFALKYDPIEYLEKLAASEVFRNLEEIDPV